MIFIINFGPVNIRWSRIMLTLGVLLFTPSFFFGKTVQDSLVLNRVFSYKRNYSQDISETTHDIYLKYNFNTIKRNPTLFLIPTMYTIAKGSHHYLGETYGQITFRGINDYSITRQISIGNIPHYNRTMPVMMKYIIPNLYGISLFDEHILSPFNSSNRKFYKYRIEALDSQTVQVGFRPRISNTQLIKGHAVVEEATGRIMSARFTGEFDMISFTIDVLMNDDNSILPKSCETRARFKFMGNNIETKFDVNYNCKSPLPDSSATISDFRQMAHIRPDSLSGYEIDIYKNYYKDKLKSDTTKAEKRKNKFKEIAWDIVGDHFLNSTGAQTSNAYVRLSPLLNPLYLSYSQSHGVSYKMDVNAQYNFSSNKYVSFNPHIGYNFKIKKLYFNSPIRYNYNVKRNYWVEFTWRNGNRITNSDVLEKIKDENRDTIDFSALDLNYFDDEMLQLSNNMDLGEKVSVTVGCIYHLRKAVNKAKMAELEKPAVYRSFAPQLTLQYRPYRRGPVFTVNYERSFRGVLRSNMEYERYEMDASFKKQLRGLRRYSLRLGGGFYTNRSTDFFVDFSNFRDNYLPGGWDDDWTGQFQLLNSQWYNASRYYLRTNASYESPLLLLTWLPFIGKYIETERLYASALQIEHTRPYIEIGYGLTNRYFSIGLFGSFLNGKFNEFGSKFTFELFRKW